MRLHDQQPGEVRRPRGLRPRDHRAGAAASRCPTPRTSTTCAPSGSGWATCSRASTTDGQQLPRRQLGAPATLDGTGLRVAVVCGRFNDLITNRLLDGRRRRPRPCTASAEDDVTVAWVPGRVRDPAGGQDLRRDRSRRRRDRASARSSGATPPTSSSWPASAPRASRTRSSRPACRSSSACSPPRTSSRRSPAPTRGRQQGRGVRPHRRRDGRPPAPAGRQA